MTFSCSICLNLSVIFSHDEYDEIRKSIFYKLIVQVLFLSLIYDFTSLKQVIIQTTYKNIKLPFKG